MSEEKKSEVTEEVKETRQLTEKELAQVSGGVVRSDLLTMRMFGPIAHESDVPGRTIGREGRN